VTYRAVVASLLVRNARIVPLEPGQHPTGDPVDVLIEEGTVTGVGEHLDRPPGVEELDGEGRWCIPGLWDQHVHLTQWTRSKQRLDLTATRSPEDVLERVAAWRAEHPGQPLIGWGHRAGGWSRSASVAELDAVSGGAPVVLVSGDAHHGWLSTAALVGLGLPPRESVLAENEWFSVYTRLDQLVRADTGHGAIRDVMAEAAARGVVGVVDLEFAQPWEVWSQRWTSGCDLLRIRWGTYAGTLDDVLAAGLRTGDPLPGCDERATMGPLKIISDGSLNTRTAWCCEPYADADHGAGGEHPRGLPNLTAAELRDLLARAHSHGLEVATHAIGDAALDQALDAYAATGAGGSIEHAQLVRRDAVRRMAGLPLRASVQPAHLLDDRDVVEEIWPGRAARCFAFRWMVDDGVPLVLGSDAPVSPLDPWLTMAAAVHRSADDREAWHPEQALTVREALAASVDSQPTVGVGSRGDLVLLDRDPLEEQEDTSCAAAALRDMSLALTVVAGSVAHRTDG
jgi:hypothetical protein